MRTKRSNRNTHKSNTTSDDQAQGGNAVDGTSVGHVWDGASSGSWGSNTTGGGTSWVRNTSGRGNSAAASVDGDDTEMLLARWD